MQIKILIVVLFSSLSFISTYGQKKFKVVVTETNTWREIYSLVDENGKLISVLDTAKYYVSMNSSEYGYFAVFGRKGFKGWVAIDANEKVLFNVFNTSFGEPTPDNLVENKIRIIGSNNLIGFANSKGQVIIKPQFEIATSFHKGKAIIGKNCKKVPWDAHAKENDCQHYSIICKKYGYINTKGVVLKMGNYSIEKISKEINWKAPDE